MTNRKQIRIGTRGSQLALWQANRVKAGILNQFPEIECVIVPITTKGDKDLNTPISEIGGKAIFLKEIEQELTDHSVDIAVHSFKDITAIPNPDLIYSGFILEESVTDSFVLFNTKSLTDALVIATGSLRRKALCKKLYPNISCVDIRGNVHTRIEKAKVAGYDGLMLSTAGLERLSLSHLISHECDPRNFIPAPGQGIIAIQQRANDNDINKLIKSITKADKNDLALNYYKLLKDIDFNCEIPFGAYYFNDVLKVFFEKGNQSFFHEFASNDEQRGKKIIDLVKK